MESWRSAGTSTLENCYLKVGGPHINIKNVINICTCQFWKYVFSIFLFVMYLANYLIDRRGMHVLYYSLFCLMPISSVYLCLEYRACRRSHCNSTIKVFQIDMLFLS